MTDRVNKLRSDTQRNELVDNANATGYIILKGGICVRVTKRVSIKDDECVTNLLSNASVNFSNASVNFSNASVNFGNASVMLQ
jgi:hypothetical protein